MAFTSPTDAFTKANMDPFIKEVWSPIIHDLKQANMSIMNFATDLSYLLTDGGDVINVPNIYTNTFTVQTQSTEGAGVVDESPAPANKTLSVDTHKVLVREKPDELLEALRRVISSQVLYALRGKVQRLRGVGSVLRNTRLASGTL